VEYALAIIILLALAWFVSAPLRDREAGDGAGEEAIEDPVIAELEARKEAKYREIRDAELDRAQGKLTEEDFRRQDAELRADAIGILKELDRVQGTKPERAKEDG
jgi:hypothetical protein